MIRFSDVTKFRILELEDEFLGKGSVRNFKFASVYKSPRWRVYRVNNDHYEYFERRVSRFNPMFAKNDRYREQMANFDYKEVYPKDEDFGINAYTSIKCPDFRALEHDALSVL